MRNLKTKTLLFISLIVFLFVFLPKISQAATYYVSTSGNDSNPGTQAQPWAHSPGMVGECTGNCASVTLSASDTVYFDNSSTWTRSSNDAVLDLRAGHNVNGGTFDGSSWGSGTRARLQLTGAVNDAAVYIGTSDITLKGFEIDCNKYNKVGIGVNTPEGFVNISNITIQNNIVHNVGNSDVYGTVGIDVGSSAGTVYNISNVSILNNNVHDIGHEGIVIYPNNTCSGTTSNVIVRGNTVYNTGLYNGASYGTGILVKNSVNNITVEFNYIHDNYAGLQFETQTNSANAGPTSITMRYNLVKDNKMYGIYILNDGGYTQSGDIYGNLLIKNGVGSATYGAGISIAANGDYHTSVFKFYNNTIYSTNLTTTNKYGFVMSYGLSSTMTIEFKNNIVYTDNHLGIFDADGSHLTGNHNNNLFWRTDGDNVVVTNGANNYTRSAVKTWEPLAQNSDPIFTNTASLPTGFTGIYGTDMVVNNNGLSVESGSALDNGVALTSLYNGAINFSGQSGGLTRPQGAGWDIGAYEYVGVSDTTPPAPPTGVTVS